jgi:hypothetical protein
LSLHHAIASMSAKPQTEKDAVESGEPATKSGKGEKRFAALAR